MKKVFSVILCICMMISMASLADESEVISLHIEITDEMMASETTRDDSILLKVWNVSELDISYLRFDYYVGDEYRSMTASCPDEGESFYRSPYSPETPEELKDLRIECSYGISDLSPEDAILQLMMGNPAEEHKVDTENLANYGLESGMVCNLVLAGDSEYAALLVIADTVSEFVIGQSGLPETEKEEPEETDPQPRDGAFAYVHDPRENPEAMADILENADAVYGFSPDPQSPRLGSYAEYDWTDPAFVAYAQEERRAYHESMDTMTDILYRMREEGASIEEMAKAVSVERNRLRLASYDDDPEGLAVVKESNLKTYGHEDGPTPDQLYEKYGSWITVMQKAFSSNMGMDACCGLYDEYYWLYIELGYVEQ